MPISLNSDLSLASTAPTGITATFRFGPFPDRNVMPDTEPTGIFTPLEIMSDSPFCVF